MHAGLDDIGMRQALQPGKLLRETYCVTAGPRPYERGDQLLTSTHFSKDDF